jgi:hypothetical protein
LLIIFGFLVQKTNKERKKKKPKIKNKKRKQEKQKIINKVKEQENQK